MALQIKGYIKISVSSNSVNKQVFCKLKRGIYPAPCILEVIYVVSSGDDLYNSTLLSISVSTTHETTRYSSTMLQNADSTHILQQVLCFAGKSCSMCPLSPAPLMRCCLTHYEIAKIWVSFIVLMFENIKDISAFLEYLNSLSDRGNNEWDFLHDFLFP